MEEKCKCGNYATRKFNKVSDEGFILCCNSDKCEKRIYDELRDLNEREKYYQGKSPASYESSAKIMIYSFVVISTIVSIYLTIKIVKNFIH